MAAIVVLVGSGASIASARTIAIGGASGAAGFVVTVPVSLSGTNGTVGAQNDVSFDGVSLRIQAKADGTPDCTVNGTITKSGTFGFLPFGCIGNECYTVRAVVFAKDNVGVIPDGDLYSCKVKIGLATPPGTYVLAITNQGAGSATGQSLATSGQSGSVTVTQSCGCGCP